MGRSRTAAPLRRRTLPTSLLLVIVLVVPLLPLVGSQVPTQDLSVLPFAQLSAPDRNGDGLFDGLEVAQSVDFPQTGTYFLTLRLFGDGVKLIEEHKTAAITAGAGTNRTEPHPFASEPIFTSSSIELSVVAELRMVGGDTTYQTTTVTPYSFDQFYHPRNVPPTDPANEPSFDRVVTDQGDAVQLSSPSLVVHVYPAQQLVRWFERPASGDKPVVVYSWQFTHVLAWQELDDNGYFFPNEAIYQATLADATTTELALPTSGEDVRYGKFARFAVEYAAPMLEPNGQRTIANLTLRLEFLLAGAPYTAGAADSRFAFTVAPGSELKVSARMQLDRVVGLDGLVLQSSLSAETHPLYPHLLRMYKGTTVDDLHYNVGATTDVTFFPVTRTEPQRAGFLYDGQDPAFEQAFITWSSRGTFGGTGRAVLASYQHLDNRTVLYLGMTRASGASGPADVSLDPTIGIRPGTSIDWSPPTRVVDLPNPWVLVAAIVGTILFVRLSIRPRRPGPVRPRRSLEEYEAQLAKDRAASQRRAIEEQRREDESLRVQHAPLVERLDQEVSSDEEEDLTKELELEATESPAPALGASVATSPPQPRKKKDKGRKE